MSVAIKQKTMRCACCHDDFLGTVGGEPHSIEKDYYLDLCPDCIDYADGSYAAYKEVINMCMTGGR